MCCDNPNCTIVFVVSKADLDPIPIKPTLTDRIFQLEEWSDPYQNSRINLLRGVFQQDVRKKSKLICDSNGLAHLNILAFLDFKSLDNIRSENETIRRSSVLKIA
jgi:hypothetical protein